MIRLPDAFLTEMKQLLGEEYPAFLQSYEEPSRHGLRWNSLKIRKEQWEEKSPFLLEPVPWIHNGCLYDKSLQPAKDVYYYGGLYYLQEPSAMTPADRLPVEPGDRVLDLCAAPGGKATELGAKLRGKGLLVANDISASRANALVKNIELFGIENSVVTVEEPGKLAALFPCFFDKILTDVPCSGEGMFRRRPGMTDSWQKNGSKPFIPLQREILTQAAKMLKPGGLLMYSTCTFSLSENEENILWFLEEHPEFSLEEIAPYEGFCQGFLQGTERCRRILPHRMGGDGHFLALLKKNEAAHPVADPVFLSAGKAAKSFGKAGKSQKIPEDFWNFMDSCGYSLCRERLLLYRDALYLTPEGFDPPGPLRIFRRGLLLGTVKNGRFSPSQAFAMALKPHQFSNRLDLSREDVRAVKYLKGETLFLEEAVSDGWLLVTVDGYPLGWGKASKGSLKNKYAPGWRMQ